MTVEVSQAADPVTATKAAKIRNAASKPVEQAQVEREPLSQGGKFRQVDVVAMATVSGEAVQDFNVTVQPDWELSDCMASDAFSNVLGPGGRQVKKFSVLRFLHRRWTQRVVVREEPNLKTGEVSCRFDGPLVDLTETDTIRKGRLANAYVYPSDGQGFVIVDPDRKGDERTVEVGFENKFAATERLKALQAGGA